jgi:hypothetical protein
VENGDKREGRGNAELCLVATEYRFTCCSKVEKGKKKKYGRK